MERQNGMPIFTIKISLINASINVKEISDRLGHESPETTWKVYAHLYPGKDRKLADALNEVRATNDNVEDKNE